MKIRGMALLSALVLVAGCASSSAVVVGKVRPAIAPEQVKLYINPPKRYEQVALLESSSRNSWNPTEQGQANTVVKHLKEEAAKIGANGVLLSGMGAQNGGSIGTGTFSGNTAFATSVPVMYKVGNGIAIYVEEE